MAKFNDDDVAPRGIRCTKAEGVYLRKVLTEIRKTGWDPLAERGIYLDTLTPKTAEPDVRDAEVPIRKLDFGISPEEFLKSRNLQPLPTINQEPPSVFEKEYTWGTDPDMLEFERGLNWDFSGINQCYPDIMPDMVNAAGANLCKQAEKYQNTNRTAYNETMEEIYNKWRNR